MLVILDCIFPDKIIRGNGGVGDYLNGSHAALFRAAHEYPSLMSISLERHGQKRVSY